MKKMGWLLTIIGSIAGFYGLANYIKTHGILGVLVAVFVVGALLLIIKLGVEVNKQNG